MIMKKMLFSLCCLGLLFSLVGCGGESSERRCKVCGKEIDGWSDVCDGCKRLGEQGWFD